jgi:protein-disulfide isomerase
MSNETGPRFSWWLLAALIAITLLVVACSSDGEAQDANYPTLEVPSDSDLTTPAPEDSTSRVTSEDDGSPPPTLTLPEPGGSVAPSGTSSATIVGFEVGFTDEGYPYRGNPDAPVTLIEYSDYACPFCGRYTEQNLPTLLEQYAASGQVRFVFRDLPLVSLHPTAPKAHTSAICAGEQGAVLYWAVHDEIFARQAEWTSLPDPTDYFAGLAGGIGVDAAAYQECVESGRSNADVDTSVTEARALGFNGTPTFQLTADGLEDTYTLIGAQPLETFQSYLNSLLAGEEPSEAQEPASGQASEPVGLPVWADTETGLQPDPDRPGVNLAGDHYKGNLDAQLVVIEFSDFECPFCRDHAIETQPAIDEDLVDSGDVLWVFKHLPLDSHPSARVAAVAAECAGDQGQFWEMHDLLFETVGDWASDDTDTDTALIDLAAGQSLDQSAFQQCFASRAALERVLADMSDARGIISQTPSFVVIQGERGSLMQGSIPADEFVASLRDRLDG